MPAELSHAHGLADTNGELRAPKVSVVLPVFNGERFLKRAIDSILGQTFRDLELVIIDDGSRDDTASILDEFIDSRLVRITHHENLGLARSLNVGLAAAAGEYVARQDADDVSEPERLERQAAYLDAHPDIAAVGAAAALIDEDDFPIGRLEGERSPTLLSWRLCGGGGMLDAAVMMRRDVVRELGGYAEDRGYAAAYDLWTRVVMSGRRLATLPAGLIRHRRHSEQISARLGRQYFDDAVTVTRCFAEWLLLDTVSREEAAAARCLLRGERLLAVGDFPTAVRLARRLQHRYADYAGALEAEEIRARTSDAILRAAEQLGLNERSVLKVLLADLAKNDRRRLGRESLQRFLGPPKALFGELRQALSRAAGER